MLNLAVARTNDTIKSVFLKSKSRYVFYSAMVQVNLYAHLP